jgi:hypothetical protein
MYDQPGRLVDDYEMLVFVYDVDRNIFGQQLDRGRRWNGHINRVSCAGPVALPDSFAVYLDGTRFDQRRDARSAESCSSRQDRIDTVFEIRIDINPDSLR